MIVLNREERIIKAINTVINMTLFFVEMTRLVIHLPRDDLIF